MNARASITITPVRVADLHVEGEPMPLYVHVIDHPDARVLVDTGMTELHPFDGRTRSPHLSTERTGLRSRRHRHRRQHTPARRPLRRQPPLRRQADPRPGARAADARSLDDYTIREWVDFDGATYVEHEGEVELLPGIRLLPAPGHTDGHQVVVVETGGRPVVVGGDVAVWFGEFDEPPTEGRLRVLALDPELVWLATSTSRGDPHRLGPRPGVDSPRGSRGHRLVPSTAHAFPQIGNPQERIPDRDDP